MYSYELNYCLKEHLFNTFVTCLLRRLFLKGFCVPRIGSGWQCVFADSHQPWGHLHCNHLIILEFKLLSSFPSNLIAFPAMPLIIFIFLMCLYLCLFLILLLLIFIRTFYKLKYNSVFGFGFCLISFSFNLCVKGAY